MSDTVTDAAATTFAAQMTARGLDPGPALAHFGRGADGRPAQQQQAAADTAPSNLPAPTKHMNYTAAQAQSAYHNWISQGLPEADIKAALAAEGFTPAATGTATPLEAQLDATFAAGEPNDYHLSGCFAPREGLDLDAATSIDRDMRQALSAMQFPKILAKSFVTDLLDAAADGWGSQPEGAAREIYSAEQIRHAVAATKAASREEFFRTARVAIDRIPAPIAEGLAQSGVLESAKVLAALYMHGQRLQQRATPGKR